MDTTRKADVIVVGAGFAGLSAADELRRQGKSVIVLEARGRSGGRALSATLKNGITIDKGAQWFSRLKQLRISALVERYGFPIIETHAGGKNLTTYQGDSLEETPAAVQKLYDCLDQMGNTLALDKPWDKWNARELDSETFASWLKRQTTDKAARELVGRGVAGGLLAGAASEYSLLQILFYLASGGGIASMMDCAGGAQDARILGGAQIVAQALAADIATDPNSSVRYNRPVERIDQTRDSVVVTAADGDYQASHVVVAIPPALAGEIRYSPTLPWRRAGLMKHMFAGYALKAHVFYHPEKPGPFWRAAGWSGCALTEKGVVAETFDNSPPDGSYVDLVVFVYGDEAHLMRTHPELQREVIINDLAKLYGPQARNYEGFLAHDWTEEAWTQGCFSAHMAPGQWSTYGPALRTPVDRIHWAGTETAMEWNGYIDGAIESGWRAAAEIAAASS